MFSMYRDSPRWLFDGGGVLESNGMLYPPGTPQWFTLQGEDIPVGL